MNLQNQAISKHRFISLILSIALIASLFVGLPVDRLLADSDNYVQNLKASIDHSTREVTVHWDKNDDADGYYIFRMFDGDSYMPYIAYTTRNEYREIPEKAGFVYYLVIPFQIRDGKQYQGTYQTNTYSYTAPPKTQNLQIQLNNSEFKLHWDASPGAVRYDILFECNGTLLAKMETQRNECEFSYKEKFKDGDKFIFKVQPIYEGRGVTLAGAVSYTFYVIQKDTTNIPINGQNFPDPKFLDYVKQFDTNKDGYLSGREIAKVEKINVRDQYIKTLKGIEYFTHLTTLTCDGNKLTELDLRNLKSLTDLDCGFNDLTYLDLSLNHTLKNLDIGENEIEKLDLSNNAELVNCNFSFNPLNSLIFPECPNLEVLKFEHTDIKNIDVSQFKALKLLLATATELTSLDVSMLSNLEILSIRQTNISEIDLTHNKALKSLYADETKLTYIDPSFFPDLEELYITGLPLDHLDLSKNPKLQCLVAHGCNLSTLDLSHNPNLEKLLLAGNNLTELDLSHNPKLNYVDVFNNSLTQINVSHNPELESLTISNNKLTEVDVSHAPKLNYLELQDNSITQLDLSHNSVLTPGTVFYSGNPLAPEDIKWYKQ